MAQNLNVDFGSLRNPSKIDPWEVDRQPLSRVVLSSDVGRNLSTFRDVSRSNLLKHAARCVTYIWAMDSDGILHIAVEELAEMPDGTEVTGYPRRRNFPRHPSEEKKLGHPCLMDGGQARVAGEFFLHETSGTLRWFVNVNSGRYCRFVQPNPSQVANVVERFRVLVETDVNLDDLEEAEQ